MSANEEGTLQGGLFSPVLSNIYLHYELDMWFEKRFAKSCRGKAYLIRYADDFIACFQDEEDARRFLPELTERLLTFDLEVERTKNTLLCFGREVVKKNQKDARNAKIKDLTFGGHVDAEYFSWNTSYHS